MVKFLVIRLHTAAHIRLSLPVMQALATQVEKAEVHFLCDDEHSSLLEDNPHIHRIHSLGKKSGLSIKVLKNESFDYIIDLQNNLQTARIKLALKRMDFTLRRFASPFRNKPQNEGSLAKRMMDCIQLFVDEKEKG